MIVHDRNNVSPDARHGIIGAPPAPEADLLDTVALAQVIVLNTSASEMMGAEQGRIDINVQECVPEQFQISTACLKDMSMKENRTRPVHLLGDY